MIKKERCNKYIGPTLDLQHAIKNNLKYIAGLTDHIERTTKSEVDIVMAKECIDALYKNNREIIPILLDRRAPLLPPDLPL